MINLLLKKDKVNAQISDLLLGMIQRQSPEVTSLPESQLADYAEQLRSQWVENEWADLNVQLAEHVLPMKLWREPFMFWIHLREPVAKPSTPPFRCPSCQNLMMDKWACISCGFELLSYEDHQTLRDASYEPARALPFSYLLLPDPKRRRLMVVDKEKYSQVVWQIQFESTDCLQPIAVALLPDETFLVADKKGQVFVCDRFGRITWRLDTKKHPLAQPVHVSYYQSAAGIHYLIADAELSWVMAVTPGQELTWSFGTPGFHGRHANQLSHPTHVERLHTGNFLITDSHNHRVIEVAPDTDNSIVWESKERLFQPRFARRFLNQKTQVVDAGHFRIVDLDSEGEIMDECVYYKDAMDMRVRVKDPIHYVRRQNTNVILLNGDRIIEVMLLHKQLIWYSLLTDLRLKFHMQEKNHRVPEKIHRRESPNWFRQQFNLQEVLHKVKVFEKAPPAFFNKLKSFLKFEEIPEGQIIVKEGDKGSAMYIIRKGHFDVLKGDERLASLTAGDIFGEMSLVISEKRTASVRATENSQVYRLNKLAFEAVIQGFPDVLDNIKQMARKRLSVSEIKLRNNKKPAEFQGSDRLKKLLEDQKKRLQALKNKRVIRKQYTQMITGQWNLVYTPLEQHVISEAQSQGHTCFELHIALEDHTQMKVARVALLVSVLEEHGTIIKSLPLPEDILNEKIEQSVSFAVLSQQSKEQLLQDVLGVVDVKGAQIQEIKL